MPWSFGYLLFGDVPDLPTLVGAGIVVAAGVYAAIRTHKRAEAGS